MSPLSSPNLIANAGFALAEAGAPLHWRLPEGAVVVDVPEFDAAGLPHASQAVQLTEAGTVSQAVTLADAAPQRCAFRLVARAGVPETAFTVSIFRAGSALTSHRFTARPEWSRCRFEVEIDGSDGRPLTIEIAGPDRAGAGLQITDIRLVALDDAGLGRIERFPVRFLLRGDFRLPSSRLRAYLVADYLDLIGWPVSVNAGGGDGLIVFQKVRRWGALLRARLGGAASVYDLDDNEMLGSRLRALDIRLFAKAVDGVTAGSEFLLERMAAWNRAAFLLDNMIDVLDTDIRRNDGPWQGRLVWFGMPENAWCVDGIATDLPVARITRGGDIEYQVKTIDRHLAGFDLALLPMPLNAETLAKNANRLVKCAALGLPVLASDTPENRRAASRLGIVEAALVTDGEDWRARIDAAAANYDAFKAEMGRARERALDIYGREKIVADWLGFCAGLTRK